MPILAAALVFQLIFATAVVNLPQTPGFSQAKQKLGQVLGIKIAQVDDSTPAPTDSTNAPPPPADQPPPPPPPDQTPPPAPPPDTTSSPPPTTDQSQPAGGTAETPVTEHPNQPPFPTETPSPAAQPVENQPTPTPEPSPSEQEAQATQTQAVLDPGSLILNPDQIDSQSVKEIKTEEDKLAKTTDPAEQTKLLVNFASDKISDINNFVKQDDFTSTGFASARFSDQISQAFDKLETLSPKQAAQLKVQIDRFCQKSDQTLRTTQLAVPEDLEQDLEINRGLCLQF